MMKFDAKNERNLAIKNKLEAAFQAHPGPRVGDFVHLNDGTLRRFTHDWGDGIQTTAHSDLGHSESFYLGSSGVADYSGSLDPSVKKSELKLTNEKREGNFWFFHEGIAGAGRGVTIQLECRVYRQMDEADQAGDKT